MKCRLRVSKKPQTVKIVYDGFEQLISYANLKYKDLLYTISKKHACCASHFDLLHKPDSTVPMYADESGLFVFGAPLTSARLSKNLFFDSLKRHFTMKCRLCIIEDQSTQTVPSSFTVMDIPSCT